jgi:hypothetical protein
MRLDAKTLKVLQALGRIGGKIGGKARAKNLTAERRSEIARLAGRARWAKAKKKKA